ncbi:diguanylate cyclase [Massilia sp. CFBP9012]|uniref:diguanylate cyclase n=1 Tax=Massilia sp. CFBP9012 TaxID=3096531 RepID=UPI002A6A8867|nr:diguanylate cyclase [Massilia sp. CFBP9012]MDY0976902.1 diguanylate cyclase [Massilia sp. CFBP9012]
MKPVRDTTSVLLGAEPTLRRMLNYWIATALLYLAAIVLLTCQVAAGHTPRDLALLLGATAAAGTLASYALIRFSTCLDLAPDVLAMLQSVFAIGCCMAGYAISGPMRAALLCMTVVIIAFCAVALRPRQTMFLSAVTLGGMGSVMWWLQAGDPLRHPPAVEAMNFGYLAAALLSTALLSSEMTKLRRRMKRKKQELEQALETIRTLATIDELTALANRRHMNELLCAEERRQPPGTGSCVALLDIDFFKQVNDLHGHALGDTVLREFASAARGALRANDTLARWGGEEFLLLLPDAAPHDARQVLERMANHVHALRVEGLDPARRISFSAGLAARRTGEPFTEAISRADKALYRAKAAGRDRVEVA